MSREHPYKQYESTSVWKALERAIDDLVKNGDLAEGTAREYIVGYLTKALLESEPRTAALKTVVRRMRQSQATSQQVMAELIKLDYQTTALSAKS